MNFFTKKFTSKELDAITCEIYHNGKYNESDSEFSLVDTFLKFKNVKRVCDPILFYSAMLGSDYGWEEGLELIEKKLNSFLVSKAIIPENSYYNLSDKIQRVSLYKILFRNKSFARTELRLELIKIIEES